MDVGSLVIVTQDFISELEEELSLFAGDIVQIREIIDKLWFRGECNGAKGKFPRSYVREKSLPASWGLRAQNQTWRLFAALADFAATEDGDLGFSKGDLLIGKEKLDSNWWRAENSDGRHGIVPVSHVWPIDTQRLPKEEDAKVNRRARVILTMTAQLGDELDLVKDEIVTVRRIIDRDWYWGENDSGCQGRFPKGFVTLLEERVAETPSEDQPPSFEECVQSPKSQASHQSQQSNDSKQLKVSSLSTKQHQKQSGQQQKMDGGGAEEEEGQTRTSAVVASEIAGKTCQMVHQESSTDTTYQNLREVLVEADEGEGYGGANGIQPYARTKYKFTSQYPNELSFDVGQIVQLIRHVDDEWTEGEHKGQVGLFPTEYVDIIVDVAHDLPSIAGTLAKALYDFDSGVVGDLHLKEGEVVVILDKISDDWYKARNSQGDIGICPVNYVQEIDSVAIVPPALTSLGAVASTTTAGGLTSASLPLEAITSLGQQHVISWLATSSPPAAPSVVSSDSGGDPKSVTATTGALKERKERRDKDGKDRGGDQREREVRSQASTPEEEDFSWDFGSPDHENYEPHRHLAGRPSLVSFTPLVPLVPAVPVVSGKTAQSLPLGTAELLLSPADSVGDKTKPPQLVPARPPPPPPTPPMPTGAGKQSDIAAASLAKVALADSQQHAPQRPAPPVPMTVSSRYENCVDPSDNAAQTAARALLEQQHREDNRVRKQREQRQCVITEMIQTERDYNQDLRLCFDTFLKDPMQARRLGIDTVTLFGNLDEVIEVSSQLLARMETEQKRMEDEQRVGACFGELVARLQDIYSHYCRNHDDVSGLLARYERDADINRFLQNGISEMQRTNNCFDLASVLIKPVQRILKYPLLINELEKATEDAHPDKQLLLQAMDDMARVATDINEVKRRKDLVSKYRSNPEASLSQRLSKLNLHSVMKKSTRLTVKMSSSLGFTTVVRDEDFEREEHRFILVEKSIKNFLKSMRTFCDQLQECLKVGLQLAEDICDFHAERCNLPEVDGFRMAQHAIYAEYWTEFIRNIEKHVVEILQSALEMLAAPHKIIAKREHKLLDLAACTARTEKNRDATRHKAFEEEEQSARNTYNALNSQLLDELPRLCSLSSDLLGSCVDSFLRARKLLIGRITSQLLELCELTGVKDSPSDVLDTFEHKHRAALQTFSAFSMLQPNLSGNPFKMDSFTKGSNFLRKSFNDKHGVALDLVPQTDAHRQWLKQEYGDNVYTVALTIQTSDPNEISLNKGDLVGLLRSADPSGNPMRWFVDNGRCKGLIASKHLLRDGHNRVVTSGGHAVSSSGSSFTYSTAVANASMVMAVPGVTSANGGAARPTSGSFATNRATPVRPTSLTSNGTSVTAPTPAASAGIAAPIALGNSVNKHQAELSTLFNNAVGASADGVSGAANISAVSAGNNVKTYSNGNALYGNVESALGLSDVAPRASVEAQSLQRQSERNARTLAAVNGEGVKPGLWRVVCGA
ncbi:dynamin-binding protein-like isoform X3 [Varroa destructor]|uniref:Dynamin-binding protein n=1 Tax=Varroa destructor TaxID=109461 RepID=A0A7M7J459_VARDE|nr:dynamin-binding protein-like isoform X3 [Varroa destructor]